MALLRHGGMGQVFANASAYSTLGSFLTAAGMAVYRSQYLGLLVRRGS
ncbi:hypothetical protein [Mycobacterium paraintracellulare]|nr:hypothetical protein [Mycobacterium paraintracellulare]BCP14067.1 hypothetical protein MINTM021_09760 [Mycobacterium paraintracellulare]